MNNPYKGKKLVVENKFFWELVNEGYKFSEMDIFEEWKKEQKEIIKFLYKQKTKDVGRYSIVNNRKK